MILDKAFSLTKRLFQIEDFNHAWSSPTLHLWELVDDYLSAPRFPLEIGQAHSSHQTHLNWFIPVRAGLGPELAAGSL
jgi:hypothetical protein